MNPDVMRAQAETMLQWADDWGRTTPSRSGSGHRDVSYQLRRTALFIEKIARNEPVDPTSDGEMLPAPTMIATIRQDEAGSGTPA